MPHRSSPRACSVPQGPVTRHFELGGAQVTVDVYGTEGPPLVLLHGIPGWRGTWRQVAARLSCRHRLYAPDLLGFGQSDEPLHPSSALEQADMVRGLLDCLGLPAAHLVGFDFGGLVALLLYRRWPERLLSLTLAATNTFADTPLPMPFHLVRTPLLGPLAAQLFGARPGLWLLWLSSVGDHDAFPAARLRDTLHWRRGRAGTRRFLRQGLRELPALYHEVEETLASVRIPSLVLWGHKDPLLPPEMGVRTASALPRATLVTLGGCGHFIPEERPAQMATEVARLVRSQRSR